MSGAGRPFLLNANLDRIATHIHGTPDLVVEVLSPSTRARDLQEKADRYLKCGVREYWILDPDEPEMRLWISSGTLWEKKTGGNPESGLLAGFRVVRAELV